MFSWKPKGMSCCGGKEKLTHSHPNGILNRRSGRACHSGRQSRGCGAQGKEAPHWDMIEVVEEQVVPFADPWMLKP